MGDAQSAQLEGRKDAAEEDESGTVEDAQTVQNIEDQSLKNKGQISEINGKADSSKADVNGHCEDDIAAEAVLSPDEDVSQTETPLKEETPLEHVEMNEKESANEADDNEDITLDMTEMDAKQNDINEGFRRFFSNIGLKLTVKRGSGEIPTDVPNDTDKEEPNRPEDVEDTTKETTSENAEQNTNVNIVQETYDNDSTTCPTLTDNTSEGILENAEENATESKVKIESNNADEAMTSPRGEDADQDTTNEEEPRSTSPSSPEEEAVVSPIKIFFTTGIFSGLWKKKKLAEDETTNKEMKDIGEKEVVEKTEQTVQDQQQDKEDISVGVEAAAVETEHEENKLKGEILYAAQKMGASPGPSIIIVTEPEVLSSQEKEKVQASPLKRLLSGSSLKKLSKKQRSRKSSDAKLSDSGEHVSDQLLSSTETAENQKEEGCAQPSTETVGEEDGAWASFKKLMTPKKRMKKSSLSNEETQIPGSVEKPKTSEGGQISDHSTEENKKRKDSSVSWDSVLCRSGRRRSRKTSDSDDETPQIDNDINKQGGGCKHGAESALENEVEEILAYSPKQAGSPSEGDGASTWKSLKRLVTPKRKAKDDDESKDNIQSDSEVTQDESSFSIKKLLPGRKKRKSAEKQDQVSSDEADKEAASGDEDSDTPAVVPLSEFDTVETEVHIQTQTYVESHIPKEADFELQQDRLDTMAEPVLPCDNLQTEAKKVQGNDDASENQATTSPATNENGDDLTESISKQQLSDIPEEATAASVTEDAARDDTIAEDLLEITSEAITAPEHLDITLADETEMISAVSQLSSESSKTSGNTTPVPAEYVIEETDALLYHVVETISTSPETVCSDELSSERKVFSVSHQILEAFVKPTILELHRSLDTTEIHTGLKVEELDANNELAAITQIASIFEVNDSVSTEMLSEVPTEEFDTAEITEDEVQEVHITHPEDSVTELESIDESHYLVECLSEVYATGSTNKLPEGELIVTDKGSLIEAHQTETETPKIDSQETDLAATVADETKDGAMEQEVPSLTPKEDQVMHNITDQIQAEDDDQQLVEVEDLQKLADVQNLTLGSEEGVSSLEKNIISEGISAGETVTYELKEMLLTEVNVEPEKEDELEIGAAIPEHVEVPEASEVEQASTLDSEEGSDGPKQSEEGLTEVSVEPENKELPANAMKTVQEPENVPERETDEPKEESIPLTEANSEPVDAYKTGHVQEQEVFEAVQSHEKEVIADNVPEGETVIVEAKQTEEGLTEVIESENKELPENVVKTVHEPEVFKVQTLDSEEGSVYSLEKDVISENVPEGETYELKEESIPLTEAKSEPVDAYKTEYVQELQASKVVQAPRLDSLEGSVQSPKEEVQSEDIPTVETVIDEHKQSAEGLTEVSVEPENKELPANVMQTVQEPELLEVVQAPTLDSEEGSVQSHEKEVISDNVTEGETYEPKEESIPLTEANPEPVDASKTEHVQEPEVLEAVQAPTLDSEEGSVQSHEKEVVSDNVLEGETSELKEETLPLTEATSEPVDASKTEHVQELQANVMQTVQESELLEAVQAPTLDSEEGSVQSHEKEVISDNVPEGETVIVEAKQTEEGLTEAIESENKELPANVVKTVQEPEVFKVQTLDSEEGSVYSVEKEVISENVPEGETSELKEETLPLTEATSEPVDASKTEHVQELQANVMQTVQESKLLEAVQAPTLDSEEGSVQSHEKEVISDNVSEGETVIVEAKQTEEGLTEAIESENKELPEHVVKTVQEPEVFKVQTLDSEEGSVYSLEKEVISENVPEGETYELKEESIPLTEATPEPVDASKTEHVQELQASKVVQAPRLDSLEGSVQSPKEEVQSEDIPTVETVIDEPKQSAEGLTEVSVEPENKELPANVMETVQEPELLEAVQAPTLDSEEGSVQAHEKEVISDNVTEGETYEPKEESIPLTEANPEPVDASKTEHVQGLQAFKVVQAPRFDSLEGSVQSPKEEVKSEDIPTVETVLDEPKWSAEGLTEVSVESENKELPVNVMETVQEPDVFEDVQAPTLYSEEGSVQSHEKEVISENVPEGETDEPKEETIPLTEANLEPVDASKTEHVQEPEVLEAVQAPTLDSEEGSVQSHEKEVVSDNVLEGEMVTGEPKQTASSEHLHEVSVEPADGSKTEQVQEPEGIQAVQAATLDSKARILLSLGNKVISEDIPVVETVTDEPKQENEVEPEENRVEAAEEPEGLPSKVKKHVPETDTDEGTSMCMHVVTESIEGSSAQEFESQILFDEANIDSVIASVTDGVQGEGVAQLGHSVEKAEDPKKESITQDMGVEQEQCIPEVIDELVTLTEVCVSSVNEEASNVQVLEKTVSTEDIPAQVSVEGKKETEFSVTEIKTATVEHAIVAQVVICDIKDVSAAIPEVLIEKVFKEEDKTAKPLNIDDKAETAEEGSVVVIMHVPLVEFEDNNRIQVQVVNDDIKSAEKIVDTVLEVGITEDKEVIDVCHGNVEKLDNISAILEIEEEIMSEQNKVLIQHVKQNLPETVPESLVVNLGQEGIEQPDAETKVSEMVESESCEVEDQKEMADSNGYILESQDETSTVISDVAATGKQVTEDLVHTCDITPHLDVSIHDQKDDLEETKAEEEKSETGVAVEEVKSNQMIQKETQMIQTLIVTPANTGLVDPQNTGVIMPIGIVESTSSLSSELQLNIQFGQEKEPPITERPEPVEKTDVPEVGVQAVEELEPAKTIKLIKVTEVAVQATRTTELAVNLDSKERAVITTQPLLLDINTQAMEPEEQVKARERVTSSVQETETMQPVNQTEKGEVSSSQPALSKAYDQETKAEKPAKQKEEDQDVWLDAEEDLCTKEKRLGSQTERKAGLELEVEMAPNSKTEEEESQQEMHKTVERHETDSEGDDFAAALEHLETEAAGVTTMERN